MEAILLELTRQLPSALAIGAVVFLFLRHVERQEAQRITNAKERNAELRQMEQRKETYFMTALQALVTKQDETYKLISDALTDHELNSQERYKRIGATQELMKRANHDT